MAKHGEYVLLIGGRVPELLRAQQDPNLLLHHSSTSQSQTRGYKFHYQQ